MVRIGFELSARQQTTLTPRLQQSVKLLQMSTLDFSREVAEAIANNPFLEEHEDGSNSQGADGSKNAASEPAALNGNGDAPFSETFTDSDGAQLEAPTSFDTGYALSAGSDLDVTASMAAEPFAPDDPATQYIESAQGDAPLSYAGDYPAPRDPNRPDTDVGQWARTETNLHDVLRENACAYELSPRDRALVELIIEALDDDGYLRMPFSELAPDGEFSSAITDTEWETALHLVQQLAAPGLGARDLSECLRLQLDALPAATEGRDLACRIVTEHLDRLGKCDYAGLARVLTVSEDDVRDACVLIRSLDPRPAARYSSVDPSCYVVPDVIVRKVGKKWVALSNNEAVPRARLHDAYAQMFRESRCEDRYLMTKALQEARWLVRSLEQRNTTIHRVAAAIVARQQTFFDYGEIALRPLMLSEIADELGMHESTVSRATSNKYLASPRGIYEFKHFFSRELSTSSGGTCSAASVRALIQEMIEAEDPRDPLSDVVLAGKLAREGVMVARRTVSKYRAQIKYPAAEQRRVP